MESTPQLERTIAALRGAYQAFNRGDIDAAQSRSMLRSSGLNLWNSPAAVPTTDTMA
jgi:hypothetical protein